MNDATADHARLIAAAPEMLEALQDCVNQISALLSPLDVPDSARAAIAKATGRLKVRAVALKATGDAP